MTPPLPPSFDLRTLDALEIEDEPSFRHVALYGDLKEVLLRARYPFRVLPEASASWNRALLLNLTFWSPDAGGDVLVDARVPADVVAHVAWHHLASRAVVGATRDPLTAEALFLGESIASAFDVYLVGRLLGHAPESSFLESQVPAMSDAAADAGLSDAGFEALVEAVAAEPERAFEDLRALLFDASMALFHCSEASEALRALTRFDDHRFAPLLHRYELSNWVLYARAYATHEASMAGRVSEIDEALRAQEDALAWLEAQWVLPALRR